MLVRYIGLQENPLGMPMILVGVPLDDGETTRVYNSMEHKLSPEDERKFEQEYKEWNRARLRATARKMHESIRPVKIDKTIRGI